VSDTQCIWSHCRAEAWNGDRDEPDDPHFTGKRSYFCLDHAWQNSKTNWARNYAMADPDKWTYAYLVLSPAQRAVYNHEGFDEAFTDPTLFPIAVMERMVKQDHRSYTSISNRNCCWECERVIISTVTFCGRCRKAKGLPDDETKIPEVRCCNWNWKSPGIAAPGHYLTRECRKVLPRPQATLVAGEFWCRLCLGKIYNHNDQWLDDYGYPKLAIMKRAALRP